MDSSQFDLIAKAAHQTPSRRRFFMGLAGAAAALVAGRASIEDALAQGLTATRYDLTCRQEGTRFYCFNGQNGDPRMTCGPTQLGCRCAVTRQNKDVVVCVEQVNDCPTAAEGCRRNSDCARGEACIRVRRCCPEAPGRGVCARRCNE